MAGPVVATPRPENRCHADIFLNVTGEERKRQQKQHANELAAHAHVEGGGAAFWQANS